MFIMQGYSKEYKKGHKFKTFKCCRREMRVLKTLPIYVKLGEREKKKKEAKKNFDKQKS